MIRFTLVLVFGFGGAPSVIVEKNLTMADCKRLQLEMASQLTDPSKAICIGKSPPVDWNSILRGLASIGGRS